MTALRTLLAVAALFIVAIFGFVWSGIYNIAATEPHAAITAWLLAKVRDRSIACHSKEIHLPPVSDPKLTEIGFRHYHAMCRLCHGAPGYPPAEFTEGLYPKPPILLSEEVQGRPDTELYWIIQNGIKMTGMPGFGPTHDSEELLGLLVFLRRVAGTSAEEYSTMVKSMDMEEGEEDHHHTLPKNENEEMPTQEHNEHSHSGPNSQ
jgi:mono/diheme cytochrome c family protein